MLIVDSHEDFAWSSMTFSRDLCLSARQTRELEHSKGLYQGSEDALLGWPDYQRGQIALIFATLFASPQRWAIDPWDIIFYTDQPKAAKLYHSQLEFYLRLTDERPDMYSLIHSRADLRSLLGSWETPQELDAETGEPLSGRPVGMLLLMEGADPILDPQDLERWWSDGVRIIGPAWAGTAYCGGTNEPGPLTTAGFKLLETMGELGFGLDLSHMDEKAALQALDIYPAQILASHSNASRLLENQSNRHLSDRVIHGILEREGVIGVVGYNAFLKPGWVRGDMRSEVVLDRMADQIDLICQLAGDPHHVGIGSDFDGGFGLQSVPVEIDTVADLQKLIPLLLQRGYSETDCSAIMGGNWLRIAQAILPETT